MKDRNYYRLRDTKQLILDARESSDELAIALGERLEDLLFDAEESHAHEVAELERVIAELKDEITEAQDAITELLENDK